MKRRLERLLANTLYNDDWRQEVEIPYSAFRALAIALSIDHGYITMYPLVLLFLYATVRDTVNMGRVPTWVLHTCGFLLVYVGRKIWLSQYGA